MSRGQTPDNSAERRKFRHMQTSSTSILLVLLVVHSIRADQPDDKSVEQLAEKVRKSVVVGNPHGLKYSVVSGVLSGKREIDGRAMLQLAMPVERGNSGGPVVDRDGKAVGILTMKSAVTENLGFAVAVNSLKPLLTKPN